MFVVWELTVDKPAVNLRVLKNRSLATGTAIGAVLGAVLFSTLFLSPSTCRSSSATTRCRRASRSCRARS